MFKAGEVYLNPVTGERAVIRIGTDLTAGERMVVDVYVQPGGRVMGEHIHPEMEERFVMLRGKVGFRLAGRVSIAEPGVELMAPPGTPHDWWNAGKEEALVRMEMRPATRRRTVAHANRQDARGSRHYDSFDRGESPQRCGESPHFAVASGFDRVPEHHPQ